MNHQVDWVVVFFCLVFQDENAKKDLTQRTNDSGHLYFLRYQYYLSIYTEILKLSFYSDDVSYFIVKDQLLSFKM